MTRYRHCPVCAATLETRDLDGHERLVCSECGHVLYRNPAPAAGVIVMEDDRLLWVQRRFDPRRNLWTFPAGFVEYDEHVEECAVREMREETGLDVEITRLFGVYMAMDDPRTRVVLILYLAQRTGGELSPGDDAVDARFFPIDEPPPIAFRAHELALGDLRRMLERDRGA
jgi:ADP-ribose pyrophosphatase YjhB (NUDIX family)